MSKKDTIDNAAEIIERFGGIRPMASKIDVAVTTVQGWKKRDAIPANRYDLLVAAAAQHDVDLSDILEDAPANENAPEIVKPVMREAAMEAPAAEVKAAASPDFREEVKRSRQEEIPASFVASMLYDDIVHLIAQSERRAVVKSTWTSIFLIILTVGAIATLFWPQSEQLTEAQRKAEIQKLQDLEDEIQGIKNDVDDVKNRQGFFGRVIPEDLQDRLGDLKSQAEQARDGALTAVEEVRSLSSEVMSGKTQALQERMTALEAKLGAISDIPLMSGLTQRYEAFTSSAGGQDLLQQTTDELSTLLSGLQGADPAVVDQTIAQARETSPVLSQSFEDVPADDLKAAALLLTMTQLRSALNRPGESFATDLGLLRNLVGEDNQVLLQSIDRLAPHAEQGVLTPDGLSSELKSLTGEIVVASLQGEDVSLKERAQARLNNVFQVEKDGELITGTPTQAKIAEAQTLLSQGNLAEAIAQMQSLDGGAAGVVGPWIEQAKAALFAQDLKQTLSGVLKAKATGAVNPYTAGSSGLGGTELVVDPMSGVSVLKR